MKMPSGTVIENKSSILLNLEENSQVFRLLGSKCTSLATAVVQLFTTNGPNHAQWVKKDTGVLCFVKDSVRKNYFFRLYCLKRGQLVWEHEVYNNLEFGVSTNFFHNFEGQDCMVGINYANTEEASHMRSVVDRKVAVQRRREEKQRNQRNTKQTNEYNSHTLPNNSMQAHKKVLDPVAKAAKKKRNLTKADIGLPLDFKHISHVGWNKDSGFDINIEDDQLKKFFEKAGVSEKQLQDRDTREFIYDFINKHGGRDAVEENIVTDGGVNGNKNSYDRQASPKVAPPIPPSPFPSTPVPPVPPRGSGNKHVRPAPPLPPSINQKPQAPKINNSSADRSMTTTDAPSNVPPPPPLPMTLPPINVDTPTPVHTAQPTVSMDATSALMQSIRDGTTLNRVERRKVAPVEDSRNDLLSEIRKGYCLKPAHEREIKPITIDQEPQKDLAGALARALIERSKAIHSEDDDDDDEDSNDEDWED